MPFKKLLFLILIMPICAYSTQTSRYLYYINEAEKSIIKDDFKHAEYSYDSAFSYSVKPFATDIFNYLKCANLNKNYAVVRQLSLRLVALGCDIYFFQEPDYLSGFRASKEYLQFIDLYPSIRKKFTASNNWKLRSDLEYLQAKDQYLRRQRNEKNGYTFCRDSTNKEDDSVRLAIINLFAKKFPNEYDYGVFMETDTTINFVHPLEIILIHNYGKFDTALIHEANTNSFDFTNILLNAVKKGEFQPEKFAQLNDRAGSYMIGHGYGQNALFTDIKGTLYTEKTLPETSREIEKNRLYINLCSLEEEREKYIYCIKKNINGFVLKKSLFGIAVYDNVFPENVVKNFYINTGISK